MKEKFLWVLVAALCFGLVSCSYAAWQRPAIRLTQGYRYDMRHDDHDLYITRVACGLNYQKEDAWPVSIAPFFEIRKNFERELTERIEAGIEFGIKPFSWFYIGESIQGVWLKEDYGANYTHNKRRDSAEAETRLVVTHKLFDVGKTEIKGFALDEYTFDLDIGASSRNELALGVLIPLNKHIETQFNWRHIDRIHDYDSDVLEAAVTVVF